MTNTYQTIGTTSKQLANVAPPCHIYNNDNSAIIYWGFNKGVTTSNGFPIPPKNDIYFDLRYKKHDIWLISDTADTDIRISGIDP